MVNQKSARVFTFIKINFIVRKVEITKRGELMVKQMAKQVVWTTQRIAFLRESSFGGVIFKSPSKLHSDLSALGGLPISMRQLKTRVKNKGLSFKRLGKAKKKRRRN